MRYRLFGNTGLKVSEPCLVTMTFGTAEPWGCDEAASRAIFDAFAAAGGNFIDTANGYQGGESERFLADFVASDRDWFVVGSKVGLATRVGDVNAFGNARKHVLRAVEDCLRRLAVSHLDILWMHACNFETQAEEVTRVLEDVVRGGKAHYVGVCNAPSWAVAQCNVLAELRGWSAFAGIQMEYSLAHRDIEAEYFPLAEAFGLCIVAWAPLAGGVLSGKYAAEVTQDGAERLARLDTVGITVPQRQQELVMLLLRHARELGCTPAQLALAWLRRRAARLIPIIGARTAAQLQDNLGCLAVALDETTFASLEQASRPQLRRPYSLVHRPEQVRRMFGGALDTIDNHRITFYQGFDKK